MCSFYKTILDSKFKTKIDEFLKGKKNLTFIEHNKLSEKIGICTNFYYGVFRYLSQYAHCTPFSLSQIVEYSKEDPKTYDINTYVLNYLNCYLALAIRDFNKLYKIDYTDDIKIIIENSEYLMKNYQTTTSP